MRQNEEIDARPHAQNLCAWVERLAVCCCVYYLLVYARAAWLTLDYPFGLDFNEANAFFEVLRARAGLPLYTAPALDYVPYIYTPLFFHTAAAMTWLTGPHIIAPRIVSLISTFLLCLLTWHWLRRENVSRLLAFCACGLFIATAHVTGHWFHMCKVDCLFMMLMTAGFYVARFHASVRGDFMAALLLILAFFTKQSAIFAILALMLGLLATDIPRAVRIGIALPAIALITWWLNTASQGWFCFYIFTVGGLHSLVHMFLGFWTVQFIWLAPCALLAALAIKHLLKTDRCTGIFYASMAAGYIGISYFGTLHLGGYLNVNIPAFYIVILLAVISLSLLERGNLTDRTWPRCISLFLFLLQFTLLYYSPSYGIPGENDRNISEKTVKYMKDTTGEILIPDFHYLHVFTGKTPYGWGIAGWDIFRMRGASSIKSDYIALLNKALDAEKFSAVILAKHVLKPSPFDNNPHFAAHYCFKEELFPLPAADDTPISRSKPDYVYVPCKAP